jgi:predicted alpha-1,2-mannosidase
MVRLVKYPGAFLAVGCLLLSGFQGQSPTGAKPVSKKRPVDYVNGLVGTAPLDRADLIGYNPPPGEELYTGFVSPGAALPHSSTDLSPVNKDFDTSLGHGVSHAYTYVRKTMLGFSNSSVPGLTVMPVVGDWTVPPDRGTNASVYSKEKEKSSPGYYTVYFPDHKIKIELTAATWTGFYRFTFPKTDRGTILLDLGRGASDLEIFGDRVVRGKIVRAMRGEEGAAGRTTYFVADFSKPFKSFGTFHVVQNEPSGTASGRSRSLLGRDVVDRGSRTASGDYAGCYLNYATSDGEQVLIKVSSGDSFEAAERKLQAESKGWDFDGMRKQAEEAWSKKLNQIEIKGGTEKERTLFYSIFYHVFASPRLVARKGERFIGLDGKERVAEYDRYGTVPFWDTGRNQIPLLTLLEPDVKLDILRSQLDMAKESGYMHTAFSGDHAVLMYLGDWQRGLKFDWEGAYEILRKNAMDPKGPRSHGYGSTAGTGLSDYLKQGWIPDILVDNPHPPKYAGTGNGGVARTLEYSWDDYCLATYAKKLGREDDYEMFLKRAANYRNVFDPSVGFMRGKTADGNWISPFDPEEPFSRFMYVESTGWGTLWLVPHDVKGLMDLLGGREKFLQKLDQFFTTPWKPTLGMQRDDTGMIGQYFQGDQPDQQVAYYYDWAGQPWKTQELTRKILKLMYGSDKYGLAFPGMDDQGSGSAWYVLNAMGFYTVDPARPEYIIGSPTFDEVTIHMGDGKDFVIIANNNSSKNIYIQSATLNGQPLNKPWFSHSDIANGGKLVFEMGPLPNKQWGSAADAAPPSMSR